MSVFCGFFDRAAVAGRPGRGGNAHALNAANGELPDDRYIHCFFAASRRHVT